MPRPKKHLPILSALRVISAHTPGMPSERAFAIAMDVSRQTARAWYAELRALGLVAGIGRKGSLTAAGRDRLAQLSNQPVLPNRIRHYLVTDEEGETFEVIVNSQNHRHHGRVARAFVCVQCRVKETTHQQEPS